MSSWMGFAGVPPASSSLDVMILMVDAVLRSKAALPPLAIFALPPLALAPLALLPFPPAAAPLIAVFAATFFAFATFAAERILCPSVHDLARRSAPRCSFVLIDIYSTLTRTPFARNDRARPLLAAAALAALRLPPCASQRHTTLRNATQRDATRNVKVFNCKGLPARANCFGRQTLWHEPRGNER